MTDMAAVNENGWGEWKALVLSKLDEHGEVVRAVTADIQSLRVEIATIRAIKENCSDHVLSRLEETEKSTRRAHLRVDDIAKELDRAKTGASVLRSAAAILAAIVAAGAGAWAWIHGHFNIVPK